jgi:hypothetical protein
MDKTEITVAGVTCRLPLPIDNPTSLVIVTERITMLDEVLLQLSFPGKLLINPSQPLLSPMAQERLATMTRSLESVALAQHLRPGVQTDYGYATTKYQAWCVNIQAVAYEIEVAHINRAVREVAVQNGETFHNLTHEEIRGFVVAVHLEQLVRETEDKQRLRDCIYFIAAVLEAQHPEEEGWLERILNSADHTTAYSLKRPVPAS